MIPALFTRMCSGWPVARNLSAKASIEAGVEQVHRLDLDVESFQRGRGLIVIARRDDDLGAGGTQHPRVSLPRPMYSRRDPSTNWRERLIQ